MKPIFNQTKKQMRKVLLLLLIATALLSVGVSYETPAKKIASVELPKIEKSYSANVVATPVVFQNYGANVTIGVYQDDVYYSETTAVDNYTLPIIEEVFIGPTAPVQHLFFN